MVLYNAHKELLHKISILSSVGSVGHILCYNSAVVSYPYGTKLFFVFSKLPPPSPSSSSSSYHHHHYHHVAKPEVFIAVLPKIQAFSDVYAVLTGK